MPVEDPDELIDIEHPKLSGSDAAARVPRRSLEVLAKSGWREAKSKSATAGGNV